ncbi:helix-turn-helix transcriptional regulator [Zhouia sp. PK063]|uniref:helix-turn-helix transcriptional regulator n=1 Tax=Zhouia sp. PK063 TaxID=3373602 RepID=UPI0037A7107A
MGTRTFEQTQQDVLDLKNGLKELKDLFINKSDVQYYEIEKPIKLDEVVELTGLTKPTLYSYVQRNEIPYHKKGNRLYFFTSEIIEWIKEGKQKTLKELNKEAENYLCSK